MSEILDSNNLRGVSRDLFQWASKSPIIRKIFHNLSQEELNRNLLLFLGENIDKQKKIAIELYKILWSNHIEYGPLPPIELLQQFEHDRVFYKDYRDHTIHSLKTFLIGLYIFESNAFINKNICNYCMHYDINNSAEDTFIFVWTLTALCHDIGYIIEHDKIDSDPKIRKAVIDYLNSALQNPLSNTAKFAMQISEEKESNFINKNEIYVTRISGISNLEEENTFDYFASASRQTHLSLNEHNGIKQYYNFAKMQSPQSGRTTFTDHGIMSALLLLKIWFSYKSYVQKISKIKCDEYYGESAKNIYDLNNRMDSISPCIEISAVAIALHNIDKEIWDKNEAYGKNIDIDSFNICFHNVEESLPLAFLLRLCDELQMWDRPRFRAPQSNDDTLFASDISLVVSNSGIYLRFHPDDERFLHPDSDRDSYFSKLKRKLKMYLQPEVINDILKYGEPLNESTEKLELLKINDKNEQLESVMDNNSIQNSTDLDKEWFVGAVNLDEDIHFSSFYLQQSMACNLPMDYQIFGYNNIIAIYDNFNETYYIPKNECITVANNLIAKSVNQPTYLDNIINKITEHIKKLKTVFSDYNILDFNKMTIEQLADVYIKHNCIHRELYTYARIPETLDRGNSTFTQYLKNYLKKLHPDLEDESKLNEVFETLTYPENLSYNMLEIVELCQLIKDIKHSNKEKQINTFSNDDNRILIQMDDIIRTELEQYRNKWAYWGYHGYRNRAIRDINYFIEKLKIDLRSNHIEKQTQELTDTLDRLQTQKYIICSQYDIDSDHRMLFKAFSKIGTVKIYRRYEQLINFYYLDSLISEIAHRFSVSEGVIRCMLPDEVEQLLHGDTQILQCGIERNNSKIFALRLTNNSQEIICGNEAQALYDQMKAKTSQPLISKGELHGDPVSMGKVRGIGRIMSPSGNKNFNRNDILVCVDSDPDLFDYIKNAGAVLAESGGLTCHTAIVCRELRIPCIVRIPGLLEAIKDGDILEVDANVGKINIAMSINENVIKSWNNTKNALPTNIGRKASALISLVNNGITVPNFICIPIRLLKKMFTDLESDGKGAESQALLTEIKTGIEEIGAPFFAIRSSTSLEDGVDFSGAGQEITRLHVAKNDVICNLENMINEINLRGDNIDGSLIVQKMIFGEISGVMFSKYPMSSTNDSSIIIETVRGGNDHLTNGQLCPTRYTIAGSNINIRRGDKWGGECSNTQLQLLIKAAKNIEILFGSPQDIE